MNYIINFIIRLVQKYFYDKPRAEHDQVHHPTDSPELYEVIRKKGREYCFTDDRFVPDSVYDKRECNKSLFVIHFASHRNFDAIIQWLTKGSGASSTYITDLDGKTIRTLPFITNPSWCQGLEPWEKGGFLNKDYKYVKQVNNFAVSVEMVGMFGDTWSIEQYQNIAIRIWHCLESFADFRFWFVCGHEHILPEVRNDPGHTFDWHYLFCECLGVEEWFYEQFLKYLEDTAQQQPGLPTSGSAQRKLFHIKQALGKIALELKGKGKAFGLK